LNRAIHRWAETFKNSFDPQRKAGKPQSDIDPGDVLGSNLMLTAEQLSAVFAAMAEGLLIYAKDGQIIEANPAAETILGLTRDQLLGKTLIDSQWQFIQEDGTPFPAREHLPTSAQITGQPARNRMLGIRLPDDRLRWIRTNCHQVHDPQHGGTGGTAVTFVDVTDHKQLVSDLRTSRADLQAILDNVPARISSWNADQTNRFINRAAETQFGIPAAHAAGRGAREIVGDDRDEMAKPYIDAALAGQRQVRNSVDRQADGTMRYSQVTYAPRFMDGEVVGYYVLGTDVTELRNSYERVRDLAQRLETIREDERRSIASMLHDGIAQDLAAAKMSLDPLRSQPHDERHVARVCNVLGRALKNCIEELRRCAHELRPTTLGHLKLADALKVHAQRFAVISGFHIDVAENPPFPALDEATRVLFFRAAQEALTNVATHAKAKRVKIMLFAEAGEMTMQISDDGIGIPEGAAEKPALFGLLGIRERFASRGGRMAVRTVAPTGTRISVSLPMRTAMQD
jgi:two-component system sensor histidine kinase UhpB